MSAVHRVMREGSDHRRARTVLRISPGHDMPAVGATWAEVTAGRRRVLVRLVAARRFRADPDSPGGQLADAVVAISEVRE